MKSIKQMSTLKKKAGFTLIELLVVIAIIGILASVVLASLNSARKKSRDARRVSDIKEVQLALELYFDEKIEYPVGTSGFSVAIGLVKTEGFLPTVPDDPLSGTGQNEYFYCRYTGGTSYHLGANLEENNTSILSGDKDAVDASCSGEGTAITGTDTGDCVGATSPARYCYDVTP